MEKSKPTIGITLDWEESSVHNNRARYTLRSHYFDAVWQAGAFPIALPLFTAPPKELLSKIDALIIPGGSFTSPKSWYAANEAPVGSKAPSPRAETDLDFIREALQRDIPLMGICAGMQELAVICGAKLTHNIDSYLEKQSKTAYCDHLNEQPAEHTAHTVNIVPNTRLHRIYSQKTLQVNTAHKEAIVKLSDKLIANAHAPDGIIEAIDVPSAKCAFGVQWHPEFNTSETQEELKIFQHLIENI